MGVQDGQLTIQSQRRDIVPIQMLRGIAATMVVIVHIGLQLERLGYGTYSVGWLSSGVDIFFVISGFIMWVSVDRRPGMTAGDFMRHRIIRIVPLYWLVSAGVLAIALLAPHLLRTTVFYGPHALTSFLFLPARHPVVTHEFWPLLVPGWTLNYEMLFYALFAISIAVSCGSWRTRFASVAALILGTVLVGSVLSQRYDLMNFYANPIIFEFLAGIVIGIIYTKQQIPRSWTWLLAFATGFVVLWGGEYLPSFGHAFGLAGATLVVSGALFSPTLPVPGLKAVGDASYSLYPTHVITLAALLHFWRPAGLQGLGAVAFMAVGVIVSILAAFCCYQLVENPMTAALRQLWTPSKCKHLPAV